MDYKCLLNQCNCDFSFLRRGLGLTTICAHSLTLGPLAGWWVALLLETTEARCRISEGPSDFKIWALRLVP